MSEFEVHVVSIKYAIRDKDYLEWVKAHPIHAVKDHNSHIVGFEVHDDENELEYIKNYLKECDEP